MRPDKQRVNEVVQSLELLARIGVSKKHTYSFDEAELDQHQMETLDRFVEQGLTDYKLFHRGDTVWLRHRLTAHGKHVYQTTIGALEPYFPKVGR